MDATGRAGSATCHEAEAEKHLEGSYIVVVWNHSPILGPTDTKLSKIRATEVIENYKGYAQETPERGYAWLTKQVLAGFTAAGLMVWCFYAFKADITALEPRVPAQVKQKISH